MPCPLSTDAPGEAATLERKLWNGCGSCTRPDGQRVPDGGNDANVT